MDIQEQGKGGCTTGEKIGVENSVHLPDSQFHSLQSGLFRMESNELLQWIQRWFPKRVA